MEDSRTSTILNGYAVATRFNYESCSKDFGIYAVAERTFVLSTTMPSDWWGHQVIENAWLLVFRSPLDI